MKKIWLFAIVASLGLGIAFGVDSLNVVHANDIPVIVRNKFAYAVTIPSELDINTLGSSGSFEISGELHKRYWMNLNISSTNSFKMKSFDKSSCTLNYSLSKTRFSYTPQYPVDNNNYDFRETINYDVDEDSILYSGEYRDNLVFNFEPLETRTVVLDCNGGDSNGLDIIHYTVRNGSTYGDLPTPVREGYTFVGWKDAQNNTIYSKSIVEPDTERLTALWYRECTTGIGSYMNGALADRLRHIGTADVYVNGELQTKNSESPIARGNEGDTFCFTNFKLENNIILKGIKSNPENYVVEYDSNGNVSKISGKLKSNASDIVLDFEYGNLLQHIIDINNADALIFDNTAPTCETAPVLNNEFDSKVVYYMKGNELHLANPDGGKVSTISDVKGLFSYLNVRYLDIQNLDISKAQSLKEFFYKSTCEIINVTGLDTSNIGNLHACFGNASKLTNIIGLETWDVSKVTNFYEFFNYCSRLQNADSVKDWNVSSATDMGRFFQGVKFSSGTIQLNWSAPNLRNASAMFFDCTETTNIDLSFFKDSSQLWSVSYLLGANTKLEKVTGIEYLNKTSLRNLSYMFHGCKVLKELDGLETLTIADNTDAPSMFENCASLEVLDLSGMDFSRIKSASKMFRNCASLKTIYASENPLKASVNAVQMFDRCSSLVGGAGTVFVPTFIDGTAARIDQGLDAPGYFTPIKIVQNDDTHPDNFTEQQSGTQQDDIESQLSQNVQFTQNLSEPDAEADVLLKNVERADKSIPSHC